MLRRKLARRLKLLLILGYLLMEVPGHKRFIVYRPLGETRSYFGPCEAYQEGLSRLARASSGDREGLRQDDAVSMGETLLRSIHRSGFQPDPGALIAPFAGAQVATAFHAAPPSSLSPPPPPAAPPQLLI